MEWYIILIIGLLPFFICWAIQEDWGLAEIPIGLALTVVWVTVFTVAFLWEPESVKSAEPITPELRITVIGAVGEGQRDTLYIYRVK